MKLKIRPYTTKDFGAVLVLLSNNTPKYFSQEENMDYIKYLETETEDYFVIENNGDIIGVGGINYFYNKKSACLSWDMVEPKFHGQGVGRQLVNYRLALLDKDAHVSTVFVRTSQHTYLFYEKFGFALAHTEKDYWAEGLDLYYLERSIKSRNIYLTTSIF